MQGQSKGGVVYLKQAAIYNDYYRRELWTGEHLQITVMSIPVGGEVGAEIHPELDQLLVVERGTAAAFTGESEQSLTFVGLASEGAGVLIPAGTYHNVVNDGNVTLKLLSVYAPPKHPVGTLQRTKAEADREETRSLQEEATQL